MSNNNKSNEPLTEEQRELVSKNHNLIYGYAYKRKIPIDDYYDILAIGLCKAAKSYDEKRCEFSTFAFKCMDNEVNAILKCLHKKTAIPDNLIVSYDSSAFEGSFDNSLILAETITDVKSYNDIMYNVMMNEITNSLTERELTVLRYLIGGLTHSEIAEKLGCNRQNITYFVGRIRKKLNDYLS